MPNKQEIKTGDTVTVIISVWSETEDPTVSNFSEGKITEIVERSKNAFYVKLDSIDRLIPIDRVCAA